MKFEAVWRASLAVLVIFYLITIKFHAIPKYVMRRE